MFDYLSKMLLEKKSSAYSKDPFIQSQSREAPSDGWRSIEDRRNHYTYTPKDKAMFDYCSKMLLKKILSVYSQSREAPSNGWRSIEDRRKQYTYISKDRRCGIADRRKHQRKSYQI